MTMTLDTAVDAAPIATTDVKVGPWTIRTHLAGDPDAPAILWLHGSGPGASALSNWQGLISSMPGFRHIAPDILGFGDSSHPEDLPLGVADSVALRARSMLQLLDELGVATAHLVGNSMGGMIALVMLLEQPERFDRAILMGSPGGPMTPSPDLISMITYYDEPSADRMLDLIGRFMFDTGLFGGEIDRIAEDSQETLATIRHDVLVMHGREDRIIPKEVSYYFADALPNAQLHVFPHAGHWVQIEQADRFRALATMFLNETDGDTA
jgi:2-hydroxymuconate-semialdehyde hydrolase